MLIFVAQNKIVFVLGDGSPLFYYQKMIDQAYIEGLIKSNLEEDFFLVDLNVSKSNKINVQIDSRKGAGIDDCVKFSRLIENSLDREKEDFELEVSTPGLNAGFKVKEQYQKYIGKQVEVITTEEEKIKGLLKQFSEEKIIVEEKKRVKVEGKKKKQAMIKEIEIKLQNIKTCKAVISFR